MYKIGKRLYRTYSEASQKNSLRWTIAFLDKETNTLIPQTAPFRCKDYFNDIVAKMHGTELSVYGFDTKTIKLNEEGVYILLSNAKTDDIKQTLAALCPQFNLGLEKISPRRSVLFLPKECFVNTYTISLLTLLIRLSNYGKPLLSWEEAAEMCNEQEPRLFSGGRIFTRGFSLPEEVKKYWYYINPNYNSEKQKAPYPSMVHNNGVLNWNFQ